MIYCPPLGNGRGVPRSFRGVAGDAEGRPDMVPGCSALAEIGAGARQAPRAIKEEKLGCFMGFWGCLCFSFF